MRQRILILHFIKLSRYIQKVIFVKRLFHSECQNTNSVIQDDDENKDKTNSAWKKKYGMQVYKATEDL